jgi:protoheme IX farnesyltransferase
MTATTVNADTTVRDAIMVFKPRIAFAIMLSALGGIAVADDPASPGVVQLGLLAIAVFLAAGSAGAFNQWVERDLDAHMRRTAGRPFVTGQFNAGSGWLAAILGLLVFAVLLAGIATNWWAALYTFLGAFTYGVVYTMWLKRRSWTNIVIGGLAGSFAVLAGAAAVNPAIGMEGLLLTVVLFLWTPPHFWSLAMVSSDDYQRAGVPMLPVVVGPQACAWVILGHTIALSLIALLPAYYSMGPVYLAGALLGGGLFTWTSIALVIRPNRQRALKNFFASLLQLCLLLGGAMADRALGLWL